MLEELNAEQREAVTATEGFIRVIAGAGSGKTRALSQRFAWLVNDIGIMPSNILCVTFTNKSANEMRRRIRRLTGDNDTGYISTFHSFCVTVLQEDINAVQYPESFLVLDNSDIDAMLAIVYEERGLTLRHMTFSNARDMIEIKKTVKEPDYYHMLTDMSTEALKARYLEAKATDDIIFYGYLYQQKKCFGLDYNDLIKFVLHIFSESEEICKKWQSRLEYIMIDEYQDIDELQYKLMRVLCGYHKNLFIVGDPDQTIYTWRGANVQYLLDFDKQFPDVRTVMMMKNYRSTPQVISVANSLISANKNRIKKELIPTLPDGPQAVYHHAPTAIAEAEWIADKIKELADGGARLSDMTILYRAHYVTRTIEEVFLKKELPYTIYSGVQFFDRAEIKDALSYLRLIAYRDDLSFTRIVNRPKRNIGERRMAALREYAEAHSCSLYDALRALTEDEVFKNTRAKEFLKLIDGFSECAEGMPVSELLSAVLDESGYERMLRTEGSQERLDNLAELKQAIYEYETTCGEESVLGAYLTRVALFSNMDSENDKNAVKLMTVHTAKGLEFPYVFLCEMEEAVFPSKKTATIEAMEEERRLAFVAVTRAEKGLFLTDAEGRNFDGSFRYPSRFLFDIDKSVLHYTNELPKDLVSEAGYRIRASERRLGTAGEVRFAAGDRITHDIMGGGTVEDTDETQGAYIIRFDSLPTPRRISFKAKLTRENIDGDA